MGYDLYPAVDENYNFPPEVREALAASVELRDTVVPMTQTVRNNLAGPQLWDNRLIFNTTIDRIDRYDEALGQWVTVTSEPAGIIKEYGGDVAPAFHVLADGGVYPRDGIYAALFAVFGTKYNTGGEAGDHFRVINRKGKTAVGRDAAQVEFDTLGKTGGEKTHALSVGEMPSHAHGGGTGTETAAHAHSGNTGGQDADHTHLQFQDQITPGTLGGGGGTLIREGFAAGGGRATGGASNGHGHPFSTGTESAAHAHAVSAEGGGGAHNNLQPYVVANFIITL